jgi:hypothetical protein
MHTLTEPIWGIPVFLLALVGLRLLVALLRPWSDAILKRVPDWSIVVFCATIGLALNWAWAYSWWYPQYAFASGPVLRTMAKFVALSTVFAFLASRLLGGKWKADIALFALFSCVLSWIFHK